MYLIHSLLVAIALGSTGVAPSPGQLPAAETCDTWEQCRDLALAARDAGDPDTFHDLAWRAVQTRRRRDPDLLFLLARAQSLSGRPHDALVTLQRLATELGIPHDVSQDEDFRRVRALAGWPELQALVARVKEDPASTGSSGAPASDTRDSKTDERASAVRSTQRDAVSNETGAGGAAARSRFDEVARFSAPPFAPGGLAYDAVSHRFVVGNLPERKLTIVARGTNRAATLAGEAARLQGVRAIEIDRRQGDLWVVSGGGRKSDESRSSELHKLQLISGRVLNVYSPAPALGSTRLVDVAVTRIAGVLALDAEGPRLLRPDSDGQSLVHATDLPPGTATSLAPADDGKVYVAYDDRLVRVDMSTGASAPVTAAARIDLSGFRRLRWHGGTLVGLRNAGGNAYLLRLRLAGNGGRVTSVETLDSISSTDAPLALDVLDNEVYYLVPGTPEAVIRRIALK